jgi:sulfur relay (sulfurtransferase) complex TusBCD TusD component (DsrE family)
VNYSELIEPLYHGTFAEFREIDINKSAPKKDFGRGFYTTNDISQALKFAKLKAIRESRSKGYLLTYKFIESIPLNIKGFETSDSAWLDFVLRNRGFEQFAVQGENVYYDIVIGPVANDAVGIVLNNFIDGVYGDQNTTEAKDTAIRLLLSQKLHNQVFFGSEAAINCLEFTGITDVNLD